MSSLTRFRRIQKAAREAGWLYDHPLLEGSDRKGWRVCWPRRDWDSPITFYMPDGRQVVEARAYDFAGLLLDAEPRRVQA